MQVETLVALGEPNRLRIVELLKQGPCSVGEIADRLSLRQPQASKHLRVLSDARLLKVEAVSRRRIYRLNEDPFSDMAEWLTSFEGAWQSRLDALGTFLDTDGDR